MKSLYHLWFVVCMILYIYKCVVWFVRRIDHSSYSCSNNHCCTQYTTIGDEVGSYLQRKTLEEKVKVKCQSRTTNQQRSNGSSWHSWIIYKRDWFLYIKRLQNYFVTKNVLTAKKKLAILLSVCCARTSQLIHNHTTPVTQSLKSYEDLVKLVQEHYSPRRSEIVQRFKLDSRMCKQKTVSTFIAELRKLSEFCNLRDMLDNMLRGRLVCGINHPGIQKRLLSESDLTLEKALEISQGMDIADHSSKLIQSSDPKSIPVQRVQPHTRADVRPKPQIFEGGSCYCCGGQHKYHKCRFRETQRHICRKKGHIAWACRNKDHQQGSRGRQSTERAHHIQEDN